MRFWMLGLLLLTAGGGLPCAAQGVVEYGGATASRTAGAGAKKVGDSVGKVLQKAGDSLQGTQRSSAKPAGGTVIRPAAAGAAKGEPSAEKPASGAVPSSESFQRLAAGMPAEELEARLGPPSFRVAVAEDGRMVETYYYSVDGRDLGSVRVVNGKVAEVRAAAK